MNKLKICKIVVTSINFVLFVAAVVCSIIYGTTQNGVFTIAATSCLGLIAVSCVTLLILDKKLGKDVTNEEENDENNKKED
ncbi:MAG: hypothetical protein K2K31_02895 [Clostridia bacterium]|nr:hypothetical protein [Clostridia bacterium]